jgi:hypothetical protein
MRYLQRGLFHCSSNETKLSKYFTVILQKFVIKEITGGGKLQLMKMRCTDNIKLLSLATNIQTSNIWLSIISPKGIPWEAISLNKAAAIP